MSRLVTEPYLLDPRPGGVDVVWLTDGGDGPRFAEVDGRRIEATVTVLDVLQHDDGRTRPVHRHVVRVDGLGAGRVPYRVGAAGYSLRGAPDGPVRLLLTSDHQLMPMVPANVAAVLATHDPTAFDGILFAGDLVNVPDRASDWFTAPRAFFPTLAPLLPYAPLLPAIGNHEVMGRRPGRRTLAERFDDPGPDAWDTAAYEALFGQPRWWSRTIGDVFVVALFAARAWLSAADTYTKSDGQFLFEPVAAGSRQYRWLERELWSPAARRARFRVVLFHHTPHGLGPHVVPPYTYPVRGPDGRFAYPAAEDQLLRDVEPLLAAAGVELVLTGHNHVWSRFVSDAGVNWLETSNVGNTNGLPFAADPGGLVPAAPPLSSDEVTAFSVLDSAAGVVRSYRADTRQPDEPVTLFDEFTLMR